MGKVYEVIERLLTADSPTDEQQKVRGRCLRLMAPLIALVEGEAKMVAPDEVSTETIRGVLASFLKIAPDEPDYKLLDAAIVPLDRLDTLPREATAYTSTFSDFFNLIGETAKASDASAEEVVEVFQTLRPAVIKTVGIIFGPHFRDLKKFKGELISDLVKTYIMALALTTVFAQRAYEPGIRLMGPLLRVMAQVMPFGFLEGQGMKLYVLCRA
jgi:hypothetical protein